MRANFVCVSVVAIIAGLGNQLMADNPPPTAPTTKIDNPSKPADATPLNIEDPRALFDQLDGNHDGQLSADEIPADKKRLFERLLRLAGKDANGRLTRDEFVGLLKGTPQDQPENTDPKPPTGKKPDNAALTTTEASPKKPAQPAVAKGAGAKGKLIQQVEANPGKVFDRLDKDGTGKLTADSVPEKAQKFVKRLLKLAGKPEDGSLSRDEFIAVVKKLVAKQNAKKATEVKSDPKSADSASPSSAAPSSGTAPDGKLASNDPGVDLDKIVERLMQRSKRPDGKLTKDDLPERLQGRFEKIDANGDGLVDATELREWLTKAKRVAEALQNAAAAKAANP